MERIILFLLSASLSGAAFAQKVFTLENTVPGGNDYSNYRISSYCGYFDHTTGEFISDEDSESKTDNIHRVLEQNGLSNRGFISAWIDKNIVSYYSYSTNSLYYIDLTNNTFRDSLTQIYADFEYAPGDRNVAYSDDGDLFVCGRNGQVKVNGRRGRGLSTALRFTATSSASKKARSGRLPAKNSLFTEWTRAW